MKTIFAVYSKNIKEPEKRVNEKEKVLFCSESDANDFIKKKKKGFIFKEKCDKEIFENLVALKEQEDPSLTLITN